jgi:hypothetical protein
LQDLPTAYLKQLQALLWVEELRRARLGLDRMEADAALYTADPDLMSAGDALLSGRIGPHR